MTAVSPQRISRQDRRKIIKIEIIIKKKHHKISSPDKECYKQDTSHKIYSQDVLHSKS